MGEGGIVFVAINLEWPRLIVMRAAIMGYAICARQGMIGCLDLPPGKAILSLWSYQLCRGQLDLGKHQGDSDRKCRQQYHKDQTEIEFRRPSKRKGRWLTIPVTG